MIEKNFIKLLPWSVEKDNFGSEYKVIDNDIIAVKLKKAKQINNNFTYIKIKIYPDNSYNDKYFEIPKSNGFIITYKNTNNNEIIFYIEQDSNKYLYYILPPSKEWVTKKIKLIHMKNDNNIKPDLNNISNFKFALNSNLKDEISDTLYIKEFFISKYEIVLKKTKNIITNKFIMKRNILNNLKSFFFKTKLEKYKIFDSVGNPLYCINPFYLFLINTFYCSICCWLFIDENIDPDKKKNLSDVWYGEKFDKIRNSIKNLSYSECDLNMCAALFPDINTDYFKNLTEIKRDYPEIADYLEGKYNKFRGLPKYIQAGIDNTCNLSCKSCNVKLVNLLSNQPKITGKEYIDQIEEIGENLEILQITNYGDPFASPIYREWLFNFDDSKFPKLKQIELLTNGILWTEENWKKVSNNAKKYNIEGRISIDGATKETYEHNRGGAKFETIIKNLEFISNLKKRNEIYRLHLNFVVQQNNYKEIPLIIDFAKKYSFDSIVLIKIWNWGSYTKDEFDAINIFNVKHPEHNTFKEICQKIRTSNISNIGVHFTFNL